MSFNHESGRLAERLATLVIAPERTASSYELGLVDAARLTIRQVCRQVLADVAGEDSEWVPLVADLTTRPVAALRGLLEFDPPWYGLKPEGTGWKDFEVFTDAGRIWREIRLHAALAAHEWSLIPATDRPRGDEAWSVVADIAAIVEAAAQLDRDLTQSHPDAAETIHPSDRNRESWEIALVADHVRQVATSGPLPTPQLPQPRRTVSPVRVRALIHIPNATARLALMLRTVEHLKPQAVRALAQSHAKTLVTVAAVIGTGRTAGTAHVIVDGIRSVATSLNATLRQLRVYSSVTDDDPRPLHQERELRAAWRRIEEHPGVALNDTDRRAAAAAVRPALDVVTALSDLTTRLVRHGDWYRQAPPDSGQPRGPTPDGSPHARLIKVAENAAATADRLSAQLPKRASTSRGEPIGSPRDILNPRVFRRHQKRPPLGLSDRPSIGDYPSI